MTSIFKNIDSAFDNFYTNVAETQHKQSTSRQPLSLERHKLKQSFQDRNSRNHQFSTNEGFRQPKRFRNDIFNEVVQAKKDVLKGFQSLAHSGSLNAYLETFEHFFVYHEPNTLPPKFQNAARQLLRFNQSEEFIDLLEQCCYGFINACLKRGKASSVAQLIQLLEREIDLSLTSSLITRKFQSWIKEFLASRQYHPIQLFVPATKKANQHWGDRYTALKLCAQTFDPKMSDDQRQTFEVLYKRLNGRYKFQLTMFLTKGCDALSSNGTVKNPTLIHPATLKLIQKLVMKQQPNYAQMAEQFLAQSKDRNYATFKIDLAEHLLLSIAGDHRLKWLPEKINEYLVTLHAQQNQAQVGSHLVTKTVDALIRYLLDPENVKDPSHPFTLLMIQQDFLSLSILLLKLILISPKSYKTLMIALNGLLGSYADQGKENCPWLIGLLETVQVISTLAINDTCFLSGSQTSFSNSLLHLNHAVKVNA